MLRANAAALPAPETPLAELATPALFLVNCYRLWTLEHIAPGSDDPNWRDGFRAAGIIPGGAVAFDAMMSVVIAVRANEKLDLRCPCCPDLSTDEANLIAVLCYLQQGAEGYAGALLGIWLPPAVARSVHGPAQQVARAFTVAGLPMPRNDAVGSRQAATRDRGLRLLH